MSEKIDPILALYTFTQSLAMHGLRMRNFTIALERPDMERFCFAIRDHINRDADPRAAVQLNFTGCTVTVQPWGTNAPPEQPRAAPVEKPSQPAGKGEK